MERCFIYGLFIDAAISSYYIASNDTMISELGISKNAERSGRT